MKWLFWTLLFITNGSALATELVRIHVGRYETVYADRSTRGAAGTTLQMSLVYDYVDPGMLYGSNQLYASARVEMEFNCKTRQERVVSLSYYAEGSAKGRLVRTSQIDGPWQPVADAPDTSAAPWKFACGLW